MGKKKWYSIDKVLKRLDIVKNVMIQPRKPKCFVCEICGCITPLVCEGSEPNTCAMCMPLPDNEFDGDN